MIGVFEAFFLRRRELLEPLLEDVSIRLGCMIRQEMYRSGSRGRMALAHHKAWTQSFTIPEKKFTVTNVRCPVCKSVYQVKVYSKAKARMRKCFFASCFFFIAASAAGLGFYAEKGKGLLALSLAVPFIIFGLWQLLNALRGRLDPSDLITHARGKVHRIFDDRKISFFQK